MIKEDIFTGEESILENNRIVGMDVKNRLK